MSLVGEAIVRIRADAAGVIEDSKQTGLKAGAAFAAAFNKGSVGAGKGASKELQQIERGAAAGSGAFTHLGRSLAFASGAFLGTAKAVDIVRGAIHSASDEQKQLERAGGLFGQSLGRVEEFAKNAATSLGLSSGAAITFANNIGQMLGPLKITKDRTAAVSIELVKLVGNLSSLRNEDPSQVMAKVSSALRGRGAALRAYGIDVSTTAIKEEALRSGIVKAQVDTTKLALARDQVRIKTAQAAVALHDYGKGTTQYQGALDAVARAQAAYEKALTGAVPRLSAQQRMQAALNIVEREGAKYQGEFTKHSVDLANKSRVLHAELSNLQTELGNALLPTVTKIADVMVKWLSDTKNQERVTRDIKTAVHDFAASLQFAYTWTKRFVDIMGGLGNTIKFVLALKFGQFILGVIEPAMARGAAAAGRFAAAWKGVGGAAETAAAETTVATKTIESNFSALAISSSPTRTATKVKSIGTEAENSAGKLGGLRTGITNLGGASDTAASKVGKLRGGLAGLSALGKIAVPVAIAVSVTDKNGNTLSQSIQAGFLAAMFGGGPAAVVGAASLPWVLRGANAAQHAVLGDRGFDPLLKLFGKGFDPLKDSGTATYTTKPSAPLFAPEAGTVVHRGHSGTVGKLPHAIWLYQLVFVGDSGASYTMNNIAYAALPGHYAKGARLGFAPPSGKVIFHYAPPDPTRIPPGARGGGGGAGGGMPFNAEVPAAATPTQRGELRAVLGFAKRFGPGSGITYHWGGTNAKTGYDCSGFLYAAYRAAGINIPRTAHDQFYDKNALDTSGDPRAGDGVYFTGSISGQNNGPPPRHCGIYIGNGKFIEYFSEGKPAKTSYLGDRKDYMGARRWIKVLGDVSSGTTIADNTGGAAPPPPGGSGVLTVGTKAAKQVLGVGLVDALAAAKRKVTAAKGGPVSELEAAIQNEIAVDRKIIAAAQVYARTHPEMVRQAHRIIASAQADIVRLGGEVGKAILGEGFSADALAAAKRAVVLTKGGPINVYVEAIQAEIAADRKIISQAEAFARSHHNMVTKVRAIIARARADIARLTVVQAKAVTKAETHEALVDAVVRGLGLPDSVLATRAVEVIRAAYEKLTDAALKAKLRQQAKLKSQLQGIPVAYVDICDYCAEVCQDSKRATAVAAGTTAADGGGRPGARGGHPNERSRPPDVPGHPGARRGSGPERSRPPDAGPLTHADRQRTQHARDQAHRDNASLRVARESRGHLASIDRKLTPAKGAGASSARASAKNLLPN